MLKILTLNNISPQGLNQLPHEVYEFNSNIQNPDAILVRSQDMHNIDIPNSVKVIGRAGAGVNNIPIKKMTELGIPVLNTPGANANAVREMVIAGMLLASRKLCQSWDYVRKLTGTTEDIHHEVEKNKKQFVGFELLGKTLGVVGLGNIGVKVANAALKLGMQVIGYDPTITVNHAWQLSSKVKKAHNLDNLLMEADVISFHIPLTPDTKNMINISRLQLMKPGVVLLNFARDGLIDKNALIDALNQHKISVYVNDFPTSELKDHPQVISFPHLGASTKEAEENCAVMIVKQIRDFLEMGTIINAVNFPAIEMPLNPGTIRLAIANRNIPNMVAQISSKLAEAQLNIISLMNKSSEEVAYTLIDVNSDVDENILTAIKNIYGVLQIRKINLA